ncbi:MAG: DUF305 domain-containing protein [Gemmatimonadetes bacterium]|nr:DUF305 domain-containing protein [Gemmatimonadota bacterium]
MKRVLWACVLLITSSACRGSAGDSDARTIQPGAPGEASRVLTTEEAAGLEHPVHSEADVRFMQGMIPHHAQALEMAALIPERTENRMIRLLGQRIEISQRDEIALMGRWLEERGEAVPEVGMGHAHGLEQDHLMPGMLSSAQMAQLADARGTDFDRLFLELMIGHHEGALVMVAELFSSVGGGQETVVHRFASDVDADQDMEIQRMRSLLAELP